VGRPAAGESVGVTLAAAANLGVSCAAPDNVSSGTGGEIALTQTASTRGAAMTAGAAIQTFLTHSIMFPWHCQHQPVW
jgi:hypothetical protein